MKLLDLYLPPRFALELLVVTGLIYLFLRFLRQTRGNRVVRGLIATLLIGTVVLYGLSQLLHLEQLSWLLDRISGFAVVILAIVFQPELRRAIAQLGAKKRAKDSLSKLAGDTLAQVGSAVRTLAEEKTGALIAIEGETPLDQWVERGQAVDAPVRQLLLQSLFEPGGALHDGAVIVRGDRLASAGCFLPLSDDLVLDATTGTRHRAALGLAEETDATTIVVSEETGRISICRGGRMQRGVAPELFESELRDTLGPLLGGSRRGGGSGGWLPELGRVFAGLRNDLGVLALSGLLAFGLLALAYFKLTGTATVELELVAGTPGEPNPGVAGQLVVLLPDDDTQLDLSRTPASVQLRLAGPRSALGSVAEQLTGEFEIENATTGPIALTPDQIRWSPEVREFGRSWADGAQPVLEVEQSVPRVIELRPRHVPIDLTQLDLRFVFEADAVRFDPPAIEIVGQASEMQTFDLEGGRTLRFAPVAIQAGERGEIRRRLSLAPELVESGFRLRAEVPPTIVMEARPIERQLGPVQRELALVSLDPGAPARPEDWKVPDFSLRPSVRVHTQGLLPADDDPSSSRVQYATEQILRYVEENLLVYVDLAELPRDGGSRTLPVRTTWREPFEQALWPLLAEDTAVPDWVELRVELVAEDTVRLEPRGARPDDGL